MIRSFACKDTEKLFHRISAKRFPPDIWKVAYRKLRQIHASCTLRDLSVPPGNQLEKLHGDRQETYSIRINKQWRICFEWKDDSAYRVEIVDYH